MKAEPTSQKKSSAATSSSQGWLLFLQRHGNKLLVVVILILLVVLLMRNRRAEAARRRQDAATALTMAESRIQHLRSSPRFLFSSETGVAHMRDTDVNAAQTSLDDAMKDAEDPDLRARLEIDRGDLNWLLASFPVMPGAATQASLATPKRPDEYLAAAQSAYEHVLKEPLSENEQAVTHARLGLAAIAENQSDWDAAHKRYQEVINDPRTAGAMTTYARDRESQLATLKRPVLLASVNPSTGPSPYIVPETPTTGPSNILGPAFPGATSQPFKFSDVFAPGATTAHSAPSTAPTTSVSPPTTAPSAGPAEAPSTTPIAPSAAVPATQPLIGR